MPFKLNADRRHHIPKQTFKVTNWHDYVHVLNRMLELGRPNSVRIA